MARVHYHGKVPYTVERGPHRGWTWYYFEYAQRRFKLLTQVGEERGYKVVDEDAKDKSTIYAEDDGHRTIREQPWPSYHSMSFECLITIEAAITIVRAVFAAYHTGIDQGRVIAQQDIKKSLGL